MANDFSGDSACKALWRFENGALTTDSKNTNTLTDNNTVQTSTGNYKEGSACADFELSNGEYFSITDTNLVSGFPLKSGDTNKKISVCAWIRFESIYTFKIFTKQELSTSKLSFNLTSSGSGTSGKLQIQTGYNSGASWEVHEFSTNCEWQKWYHIGATYQDSDKAYRLRIWDDSAGALLAADLTGTGTNAIYVSDAPLYIGARNGGNEAYDGLIDELVVFNDILTTDEIDAIRAGTYGAGGGSTLVPINPITRRSRFFRGAS